jgi:hypothetical protein
MRTALTLLAALLALLVAASPVAAHHGKGSHARSPESDDHPRGSRSDNGPKIVKSKGGGFAVCDWQSDPGSCPGNSGWAHWCKENQPAGLARGLCVSEHARAFGLDLDRDDDNDNGNGNDNDNDGQHGDLQITDIDVDEDGWFRVRGNGAEGQVTLWVGGGSDQVVGFGEGPANQDGHFEIVGLWACRDDDHEHDARVRAQDSDERDSEQVTFPCDEED